MVVERLTPHWRRAFPVCAAVSSFVRSARLVIGGGKEDKPSQAKLPPPVRDDDELTVVTPLSLFRSAIATRGAAKALSRLVSPRLGLQSSHGQGHSPKSACGSDAGREFFWLGGFGRAQAKREVRSQSQR